MAPITRSHRIALAIGLLCLSTAGGVAAQTSPSTSGGTGATGTTPTPSGSTATSPAANTLRGAAADRNFMDKAAMGGMAEVQLSQVAQQKATRDDVKQFAARMVQDHTQANDELKSIAAKHNVTLPTAPDRKHEQALQKLQSLTAGEAFDRQYVSLMLADHKETVALFRNEARTGKNPDAKAFAAKTLPHLEEHLQMVQNLSKGGGKSMAMGSGATAKP
jgi:putative membrane protein